MTSVSLDDRQQGMLAGAEGRAAQLAMRLIASAAEVAGATELVPIEMAHISSCHYSGQVSLDFGELLAAEGAQLAVPTHTNASLIACRTPELRPREQALAEVDGAERLMKIYEALGCTPMWTCAPYQQAEGRPAFGQQVVGSESNAVGFFNSVLGARTERYGDFLDACCALTGRAPLHGLHLSENRRATVVVDLADVPDRLKSMDAFFPVLGSWLGREVGGSIPTEHGVAGSLQANPFCIRFRSGSQVIMRRVRPRTMRLARPPEATLTLLARPLQKA